jgi:hypothetical protein
MGQADVLSSPLADWPPLSAAPRGHGPCPPELRLCSCERCCRGRPRCAHPHLWRVDRSMMRGSPRIETRQRQDSASCKPLRADHQAAAQASTMRARKSPSLPAPSTAAIGSGRLSTCPATPSGNPGGAGPCILRAVPGTAIATRSGIWGNGRWQYGSGLPAPPRHRVSALRKSRTAGDDRKDTPSHFTTLVHILIRPPPPSWRRLCVAASKALA